MDSSITGLLVTKFLDFPQSLERWFFFLFCFPHGGRSRGRRSFLESLSDTRWFSLWEKNLGFLNAHHSYIVPKRGTLCVFCSVFPFLLGVLWKLTENSECIWALFALGPPSCPTLYGDHSWPLGIWGNVGWFLVTCVTTPFQPSAQRYSSHFFSWEGILTLGGSAPNRLEEFRIVGLRISWPRRRILFRSTVFENHILETAGFSTQVLSWKEVRKLSYF